MFPYVKLVGINAILHYVTLKNHDIYNFTCFTIEVILK